MKVTLVGGAGGIGSSVAFNLLPKTPAWLQALHAAPMNLWLDLQGGVHFLMQIDVKAVVEKRLQGLHATVKASLRDKNIRYAGLARNGDTVEIQEGRPISKTKAWTVTRVVQAAQVI